jgi:RHS repeat-associated protein
VRRIHAVILFMTLGLLGTSFGQVVIGTPPLSSFGGGPFDTVNLGNLNVHFSVPVFTKAGRGTPFSYSLGYDSSVWYPVTSNGVTSWVYLSNWGWTVQSHGLGGSITTQSFTAQCMNPGPPITWYYPQATKITSYTDPMGTAHRFMLLEDPCDTGNIFQQTTHDGSGWTVTYNQGSITATSRGGETFVPGGTVPYTDPNGNQLTANSSGQFFDTLSSTTPVLTVAGNATPASPTTLTYTAPTGGNATYTVNYTQYTVATNFGVSGIVEYGPLSKALISSIALPDGSSYTFTYEQTPGSCNPLSGTFSYCITARLASVTLPTSGSITYAYSGGSNGIESDGTTANLTRTLSPGGQWQYARTQVLGAHWQTWVTSPPDPVNAGSVSDMTIIDFEQDANTSVPSPNFYETQRLAYQGGTSGTLLSTIITCYNGNGVSTPSSCASTAVTTPLLRTTVFRQLPNASGLQSKTDTSFGVYGVRSEVDDYDYGNGAVGPLIRQTTTGYASLARIFDHTSSVIVKDGSNNVKGYTVYNYDETTPTQTTGTPQHVAVSGSRGLLTSVAAQVNGTTTLYRTYTYYDTGNLKTSTDVSTSSTTHGAQTTYNYSSTNNASCGNSFVTSISEPLSLSRSMTWNCTGGVLLSLTDENGNTSSTAYSGSNYSNLFWRPYSTTDQAGTTTNYFYYLNSSNQPFQTETKYASTFNSGNSIRDILSTNDGFGRGIFQQTKQGPSATNYDTVATCYDSFGRRDATTLPYSAAAATSNTQSCSGLAQTDYTYDALGRTASVSDSGGGSTTYAYTENDVLQTLTSPTQKKQQQYDALGRLTSVCEITGGTTAFPGSPCNQNTGATGYLTQYAYDPLGNRTSVTQNAQASSGHQTRSFVYDMLGRLTSETNPEMNNSAVTYSYDSLSSDAACGTITSAGNMLKRLDAAGNATCYSGYDALHRVGGVIYPSTSTPAKNFVYDTAMVNGTAMVNAKTHLAEAYTCIGTCSSKITDLGFSYATTGQTSDVWELTPNSGVNTYYHVSSLYWPNGAIETLSGLSGLPTINYATEGEGRMSTVTSGTSQSPVVSSIAYDPSGHVTAMTYGSSDSDAFVFDSNTGRMTKYTYSVGGSPQTDIGQLTWNTNASLQKLVITDQLNPADSQTCNYTHDDLGRVASANCGASTWSQTFSYDPFGNITKTVPGGSTGTAFQPTYDYTNNSNRITSSPFTYNGNNGNMTADNSHAYSWDTENKLTGIDSGTSNGVCQTYDALGRVVEQDRGSACTTSPTSSMEIVYSPSGAKLALMNGSSLVKAFVSLPAGAQAVYNSSGLQYYRHPDWLGSPRLASTSSRTPYYSGAYAPFGENYVPSGTQDLSFTGQNQDTESSGAGGAGGLYDFLYREHSPVQGRWLSPDPSGLAAVNANDPQSWNRYAYVGNRPTNAIDRLGLIWDGGPWCVAPVSPDGNDGGSGGPGSGGCNPGDPLCFNWCGLGVCNDPTGGIPGEFPLSNEAPPLPSGLDASSAGLDDLLGFLPGLSCGGGAPVTAGFLGTGTPSDTSGGPCPLRVSSIKPFDLPLPNVPPGSKCDKYPAGPLREICKHLPDDPIDNCVRGCLLDRWDPIKGTYKGGYRLAHCECFASCGALDPNNPLQDIWKCSLH